MIMPNAVNFEVQSIKSPAAQPASAVLNIGAAVKQVIVGGETKLDACAREIAASMAGNVFDLSPDDIAERAVKIAVAVRERIDAHENAQQQPKAPELVGG